METTSMSEKRDIVTRLRDKGGALRLEAADLIETLRAPKDPSFSAMNFPIVETAIMRVSDGSLYRIDPASGTVRPVPIEPAISWQELVREKARQMSGV